MPVTTGFFFNIKDMSGQESMLNISLFKGIHGFMTRSICIVFLVFFRFFSHFTHPSQVVEDIKKNVLCIHFFVMNGNNKRHVSFCKTNKNK